MSMPTPSYGLKERNVGVDIAKIVAMFFVVAIHSCSRFTLDGTNLTLVWIAGFFKSIMLSCIDLFALATGYLCLTSSCKYSRVVNLWFSTVFWGFVMLIICESILGFDVPGEYYVNAVFPILRKQYWFFTAYFMLFFFVPLINKAIMNIGRKDFDRLLFAMLIFMGVYSWAGNDIFNLNHGYSFVWLLSMYLVGGYIRKYNPIKLNPAKCFLIALVLAFLSSVRLLLSAIVGYRIPGDRFELMSYVSPFTIGIAFFIFAGCLRLKVCSWRGTNIINKISATTFGIYLIHEQPFVREKILIPVMHKIIVQSVVGYVICVFTIPVIAFIGMTFVEHIRLKLFEKMGVRKVLSGIDRILPRSTSEKAKVS